MPQTSDTTGLLVWLDQAIDELPSTGQIVLNFDGNVVKWEVRANHHGHDRNGDHERIEVRRFGRLVISRRAAKRISE